MRKRVIGCVLGLCSAFAGTAMADESYSVTITNISHGISFTPVLAITHKAGSPLFHLGAAASDELAAIAEGGATAPFKDKLFAAGVAKDAANSSGLLAPGASVSITVAADGDFNYLTVAAMLLPTNDGFFALNGQKLPDGNKSATFYSPGYDAGSENNDELCASIPGPDCGGEAF